MNGLILVNKPQDFTSHDIVNQLRNVLNFQRIGHFGTLDPLATGLLAVGIGQATRLFPFFSKLNKFYRGQIRLGFSTNTYDCKGETSSSEVKDFPDRKKILDYISSFKGELFQTPPPFSAKKYRGKPAYYFARKKIKVNISPVKVKIFNFQLNDYDPPFIDFNMECSSGTYIRSIANDLGNKLGCGGHLTKLERTKIGIFHLKESHTIEEINNFCSKNQFSEFIIPLESLFPEFPKVILREKGTNRARNGNFISLENILKIVPSESKYTNYVSKNEEIFRLFNPEGRVVAFANKSNKEYGFDPFLVFNN